MTAPTAAPLPDTLVRELREQAKEAHGVWDYAEELMTRAADRIEAAAALAQRDDDALQNDLAEMLRAVGLSDAARPYSPHETVQRELLPRLRELAGGIPRDDAQDKARLDWLESTREQAESELGVTCGWHVDETGAPIIRGELESYWSRTLRDAIDAAMTSESGEQKSADAALHEPTPTEQSEVPR